MGRQFALSLFSIATATPAVWVIRGHITVTPLQLQLRLIVPVVAAGVAVTLRSWKTLELDR